MPVMRRTRRTRPGTGSQVSAAGLAEFDMRPNMTCHEGARDALWTTPLCAALAPTRPSSPPPETSAEQSPSYIFALLTRPRSAHPALLCSPSLALLTQPCSAHPALLCSPGLAPQCAVG